MLIVISVQDKTAGTGVKDYNKTINTCLHIHATGTITVHTGLDIH